jgi:hypothetical protein
MLAKEKEKELRAKEKAAEEKRKKGTVNCPCQPFLPFTQVIKRRQSYSSRFRWLRRSRLESVCAHLSRPKYLLIRRRSSDPKTILCVYFKAGHCDKGNKCKFSHDMNIGRKVEKKDLYSDSREEKENGEDDSFHFFPGSLVKSSCLLCRHHRHHGQVGRREAPKRREI